MIDHRSHIIDPRYAVLYLVPCTRLRAVDLSYDTICVCLQSMYPQSRLFAFCRILHCASPTAFLFYGHRAGHTMETNNSSCFIIDSAPSSMYGAAISVLQSNVHTIIRLPSS